MAVKLTALGLVGMFQPLDAIANHAPKPYRLERIMFSQCFELGQQTRLSQCQTRGTITQILCQLRALTHIEGIESIGRLINQLPGEDIDAFNRTS